MKIALIGQPNSGKSTLFNAVAGYKSVASNFPGSTVKYTQSKVHINGQVHELIDFPGTYSLSATNEAEAEIIKYLLKEGFDVVVNVIDASQLGRSLPLTLELLELEIPVVVALNMVDEAKRKGIEIDAEKLSQILGVPVIPTVASHNTGVRKLFATVKNVLRDPTSVRPHHLEVQRDVEKVIRELESYLAENYSQKIKYPRRFLALKLLEDDDYFLRNVVGSDGRDLQDQVKRLQKKLVRLRGKPQETIIALERHALAMEIYHQVVTVGQPKIGWQEKLDNLVMHKYGGYVILIVVLVGFFNFVFYVGSYLETYLLSGFDWLNLLLDQHLATGTFVHQFFKSLLWGISGGMAIVLPYLTPFLVGLNFLEDIGYLPRMAFLMDSFMHRIGLHGTAIIPAILGYGCNVPAVMATRILPSRTDRLIAGVIASMVPCSARSIVIFGLVAYYLGPLWALMIYVFNILIIALTGKILTGLMPEVSPGMIMEIPSYRMPSWNVIKKKTWFRIKEFIVIAWPILIAGSIVLGFLEYFHLDRLVNLLLSPLTDLLGLPSKVGVTMIFGVLRKELSLIMLTQALGTTDVIKVMTTNQILTFTVFITFYIPCVATMAVLSRELGRKWMLLTVGITLGLAIVLAWTVHIFGVLF